MNRYEKYKDSGIEWIGEIPEHWKLNRIRQITEIFGRIGYRGYKTSDLVPEGFGAITISPSNMKEFHMEFEECTFLSWAKYDESPEIQIFEGDILFVKTGSTYGKCSIVPELPEKATINPQIIVFKNILCDKVYLWYALKSNFTDFQVQTTVVGGTIPTISQEKIRNYFIALPQSKKEQTSIASYLDRKTSEIDRIIANKQKLIALYEEEKQAIINQAVTKGLDLNVKLKDSGVEWLGEIPEHWEVKKLMYLVKILSGYSPEQCQPSNNGDIEYIKVDDVDKNNFEVTNPSTYTSKKFIVSIGQTILFPKRGAAIALNKVGVVNRPICFDTNLMGLKLISENNEVFYIAYLLKSFSLISLADTSTIPQINNKHIGPFQIPLPPLIEQRDILEYINIECDKLNNIIAKVKKQIDLLREYRTTLISEVVTGKIKVPNTIEA